MRNKYADKGKKRLVRIDSGGGLQGMAISVQGCTAAWQALGKIFARGRGRASYQFIINASSFSGTRATSFDETELCRGYGET
jgi:hypothetical protein